jgi:hypothetical protein
MHNTHSPGIVFFVHTNVRIRCYAAFLATLTFLFCYGEKSCAQSGLWTWISGSNLQGVTGVYGIQGVPSVNNFPPGLYAYSDWKDKQGNFWLYGGWDPSFADLWKYDPLTNEWTWVKGTGIAFQPSVHGLLGVPDPANTPGVRSGGAATWVDTSGSLWLFGGGAVYNDLWKYDIASNIWTWMSGPNSTGGYGNHGVQGVPGPTIIPGSRQETRTTWTDSLNNLWLFGGWGNDDIAGYGPLGDLMKFDISTGEWTWMSGASTAYAAGVYGTKGVSSPANYPGTRMSSTKYIDKAGNFWVMGGGFPNLYNDMWKYDPGINEWTWMAGSSQINHPGVYLSMCVFDTINMPIARDEHRSSAVDNCGRFWLFAGSSDHSVNYLNDLWVFDPVQVKWNWLNGTNIPNQPGNYGTMGVAAATNFPPSRWGAISWWGDNNKFYVFGGSSNGISNNYSDLWVYEPDSACGVQCNPVLAAAFTAPNTICPGTCTDFTSNSPGATSYAWSFPGGNPSVSTDANPVNICYSTPGSYAVTLIVSNAQGGDTLTLNNYITVYPSPAPQAIIQIQDSLIANQGAVSYQWYFNGSIINGATDYFYVAQASGSYNVVATDVNGCEVEAVIFDVVASVAATDAVDAVIVKPNPFTHEITISAEGRIKVFDGMGQLLLEKEIKDNSLPVDLTFLARGIYFLHIEAHGKLFLKKLLKM